MSRPAHLLLPAVLCLAACGRAPEPAGVPGDGGAAPEPPAAASGGLPVFEDATRASGLQFRHVNGATGRKYMPETLGAGTCVFDFDGDGLQDVYFVQSGPLPGFDGGGPIRSALFRNLGAGRFADVTGRAGVGGPVGCYGFGCTAGDIDGDGDRDLFVTCYGPDVLYRNEGDGRFTDVTARAGVGNPLWGTSAGFADYDGDGDLDLYVANYVAFDPATDLYCGENRPGWRTVCHPRNFDSQPDALYRNRGDGTFEDVTRRAGIDDATGKGLGVVWGDLDADGDEDLYVANDDTPNFLWRNRGDGTFEEVGELAGVALSEDGLPQAGMGTDLADYDDDGRPDLFVTNLAEETNALYRNEGGLMFSNATFISGLGAPSILDLGFGTVFFDADHDGDQDLFVANGHIIDNIALYSDTVTFEQPVRLYRNLGGGRFDLPAPPSGSPLRQPRVGRGAVAFDADDDGDLDLLITENDRPAALLRNTGTPGRHWLQVLLAGAPPNRDAIGAVVSLEAGGVRRTRFSRTAMSYLSQGDRRLHFGLNDATRVERIVVRWPGRRGFVEEWRDLPVDRALVLEQGKGRRP
ncbi:MAG: CRTAC1 family protein [Candidatus Polarisedimenticolia bacterium]